MTDPSAPRSDRAGEDAVGPTDRAIDASGHRVWFNGVCWFHEDPQDDEGCAGASPLGPRTPDEERMVRFGYYLALASNLLNEADPRYRQLTEAGYEDLRAVCREASEWCYGPGREAARTASSQEATDG